MHPPSVEAWHVVSVLGSMELSRHLHSPSAASQEDPLESSNFKHTLVADSRLIGLAP